VWARSKRKLEKRTKLFLTTKIIILALNKKRKKKRELEIQSKLQQQKSAEIKIKYFILKAWIEKLVKLWKFIDIICLFFFKCKKKYKYIERIGFLLFQEI